MPPQMPERAHAPAPPPQLAPQLAPEMAPQAATQRAPLLQPQMQSPQMARAHLQIAPPRQNRHVQTYQPLQAPVADARRGGGGGEVGEIDPAEGRDSARG